MVISSLLVCSLMVHMVYAFQSTPLSRESLAMTLPRGRALPSRTDCSEIGSISDRVILSRSRGRRSILSTRLQYSSDMDDSSNIPSQAVSSSGGRSWLKTLFIADSPESAKAQQMTGEEQESVDAYLEFLDRRYKRLHSDDREAEQSKSKSPTTFSAMNWLLNGNDESMPSKQQSEDALYVLGVAGLASQKLLQKHHLEASVIDTQTSSTSPSKSTLSTGDSKQLTEMGVIEVKAVVDTPSNMFIRKVMIPLIRAICVLQRRKQLLQHQLNDKLKSVGMKAVQKVIRPLRKLRNPRSVVNALLNLGGGRHNIMVFLACGYATILLVQPVLKVAVSEASVRP